MENPHRFAISSSSSWILLLLLLLTLTSAATQEWSLLPPCNLGTVSFPIVLTPQTTYLVENCAIQVKNSSSQSAAYVYTTQTGRSIDDTLSDTMIVWRNVKATRLDGVIDALQSTQNLQVLLEECDFETSGQRGLFSLLGAVGQLVHSKLNITLQRTSVAYTLQMLPQHDMTAYPILSISSFDNGGSIAIVSCTMTADLTAVVNISSNNVQAGNLFELSWIMWTNVFNFNALVWSAMGPTIVLQNSTWFFTPSQAELVSKVFLSNFEMYLFSTKFIYGNDVRVVVDSVSAELIGAITSTMIQFYKVQLCSNITVLIKDSVLVSNSTLDVGLHNEGRTSSIIYFSSSSIIVDSLIDISNSTFVLVGAPGYTHTPSGGGMLSLTQTTALMLGVLKNSTVRVHRNTVVHSVQFLEGVTTTIFKGLNGFPVLLSLQTATIVQFGVNATCQNSSITLDGAQLTAIQGVFPSTEALNAPFLQPVVSFTSTILSMPLQTIDLSCVVIRCVHQVFEAPHAVVPPSISGMSLVSNFQAQNTVQAKIIPQQQNLAVPVPPSSRVTLEIISSRIEDHRVQFSYLRSASALILQGVFENASFIVQDVAVVAPAMLAILMLPNPLNLTAGSRILCDRLSTPVAALAASPVDWSPFVISGVNMYLRLQSGSQLQFRDMQITSLGNGSATATTGFAALSRSWVANVTVEDGGSLVLEKVDIVSSSSCSHLLDVDTAIGLGGRVYVHCSTISSSATGPSRRLELRDVAVNGNSQNMAVNSAASHITFENCPLEPWWSHTIVVVPPAPVPLQKVPTGVLRAISVMGFISMMSTTFQLAGGGGGGISAGKVSSVQTTSLMILARRRCMPLADDDASDPGSFLTFGQSLLDNPLQIRLDNFGSEAMDAAGTVVGNVLATILLTLIAALWDGRHALHSHITTSFKATRGSILWSVLSARMPSPSFSPVMSLSQPTVTAALVLLVVAMSSSPMPVGAILLSVLLGLLSNSVVVSWLSFRLLRRNIPLVRVAISTVRRRVPAIESLSSQRSSRIGMAVFHELIDVIRRFGTPQTFWSPSPISSLNASASRNSNNHASREFKRRYERWVEEYRQGFHFYALMDLYQSAVVGVIAGITIAPSTTPCSTATGGLWVIGSVCLVGFVAFIFHRPCETRASLLLGGVIQSLSVVAAVLSVAHLDVAAAWVGFIQGLVVLVVALVGAVSLLEKLLCPQQQTEVVDQNLDEDEVVNAVRPPIRRLQGPSTSFRSGTREMVTRPVGDTEALEMQQAEDGLRFLILSICEERAANRVEKK